MTTCAKELPLSWTCAPGTRRIALAQTVPTRILSFNWSDHRMIEPIDDYHLSSGVTIRVPFPFMQSHSAF